MFSSEFCEFSKKNLFCRTPPVAASTLPQFSYSFKIFPQYLYFHISISIKFQGLMNYDSRYFNSSNRNVTSLYYELWRFHVLFAFCSTWEIFYSTNRIIHSPDAKLTISNSLITISFEVMPVLRCGGVQKIAPWKIAPSP